MNFFKKSEAKPLAPLPLYVQNFNAIKAQIAKEQRRAK